MTVLQVIQLSTNHKRKKKNATTALIRRSLRVRKYNYVGLSEVPLRPHPAIIAAKRRQKGHRRPNEEGGRDAIHVRRLGEKCTGCWKI